MRRRVAGFQLRLGLAERGRLPRRRHHAGRKKHHVVLIDFNSNGRFDDEIKLDPPYMMGAAERPSAESRPQQGDMLLVDPKPGPQVRPTTSTSQRSAGITCRSWSTSTAGSTT